VRQYVAFDVSKQTSEVVIVDEAGTCLVRRKVRTDPLALAAFVDKHGENVALVVFEAGPLSTWLYHELKAAGLPVVCMDAWRARAALSARINKTDRTDALGLADLLRVDFHHGVHVKSYAAHELRMLLKARDVLVAQRRTLQNKVRGLLETFGLILGPVAKGGLWRALCRAGRGGAGGSALAAARDRAALRGRGVPAAPLGMGLWREARQAAVDMHRQLRRLAEADADCRRLMTTPLRGLLAASLPGIGSKASWPSMAVGPLTALAFKSAVDEPARFHDSRAVGAYFGLTPKRHQSGKMDHTGKISRAGDGFMRSLLFEAAQCLYFRSKRDTALKSWAQALAARSGTKKALAGRPRPKARRDPARPVGPWAAPRPRLRRSQPGGCRRLSRAPAAPPPPSAVGTRAGRGRRSARPLRMGCDPDRSLGIASRTFWPLASAVC
jgi:transposase